MPREQTMAEIRRELGDRIADCHARSYSNMTAPVSQIEALLAATPSPAAEADLEAIQAAEREKIARQIEEEADLTPCVEDANVIRHLATLVRAKFSYDQADRIEAAEDNPATLLAEVVRLKEKLAEAQDDYLRRHEEAAEHCEKRMLAEAEVARLRAREAELVEGLENVVIAYGMGWDMDGVIDVARALINGGSDG